MPERIRVRLIKSWRVGKTLNPIGSSEVVELQINDRLFLVDPATAESRAFDLRRRAREITGQEGDGA